jgi:RNA polymerase sigma-70 factor (ECF subfamily)
MRTIPLVGLPKEESAAWAASLLNDGHAFAVIFDLHRDRLYHHALRMTTNIHDSEDVGAAAFFELWRFRKSVPVVDTSMKAVRVMTFVSAFAVRPFCFPDFTRCDCRSGIK